jgi:hypothetical protein
MTDTVAPILLAATRREMRGLQGVGKSSMLAILTAKIILQNKSRLFLIQG